MRLLALLALALASAAHAEPTATVATSAGPVIGDQRDGLDWYLGIPYAAPPVGALRWRPPEAPQPWSAPRQAKQYGNWCMQVAAPGFSLPSQSEDCLYLNVIAPHATGTRRPVMVWIHGGGMRQGRANDYDPTPLVRDGVVFVSFNYRLNAMGFLAHRALDGEGHAFANYGLMDQQAALAWVHKNIAAFGGDPANVTLIGESSGGANVFAHLVAPHSAGLFTKAIVESGSLWYGDFAPFYNGLPRDQAEQVGETLAAKLGCTDDSAQCLRAAPIEKLMAAIRQIPTYAFGEVIDGTVLDQPLRNAIVSGRFRHVPIINGSNADEWTWVEGLEEAAAGHPLAAQDLAEHLKDTFGDYAARAAAHYPPAKFGGSAGAASGRAVTDGLFVCPLLALNRALARFTTVYGYEFADRHAPNAFRPASFPYGAAHTLEMAYLFRDYHGALGQAPALSPDQRQLSRAMVGYWTAFARTGNPNGGASPHWPAVGATDRRYLSLQSPRPIVITARSIDTAHQCSPFWRATEGTIR
jgi:para-nitrobenzyl esterase